MRINKSLDIDLNIVSPQRNIRIHEGDIDSIDIVLAVSVDDVSLDLTGLTIKYDATINNYLAEQDADGSVVDNKIVIPVTENMTAMPGLLLVDVRMIQDGEILFTRTIRATVERAVVNGSTYIDFSKITINQRLNALEEQMAYVEELVDGLDTSKQITSNRRPPQTAPATVDVDFFRVGDTWILQGVNIVYKLVEAEYNYQPDPEVPAVHKFKWQPLNERFNYGTTEPPTSATYTEIEYVIGELTFNALPVPEYFIGDTYARVISGAVGTLFTLTDSAEVSSGQYTFSWHENGGGGDADNKMTLAPIDPTAQEIEDMPSGQLYGDTVDHKGIVKNGQEFYDTQKIDELIANKQNRIYYEQPKNDFNSYHSDGLPYAVGDLFIDDGTLYKLHSANPDTGRVFYNRSILGNKVSIMDPPTSSSAAYACKYAAGDIYKKYNTPVAFNEYVLVKCYVCKRVIDSVYTTGYHIYEWQEIPIDIYSKTEINAMIGDIGTALDTLNDNLAEV